MELEDLAYQFIKARLNYIAIKTLYTIIYNNVTKINASLNIEDDEVWAITTTENDYKYGLAPMRDLLAEAEDRLIKAGRQYLEAVYPKVKQLKQIWDCIHVRNKLVKLLLSIEIDGYEV